MSSADSAHVSPGSHAGSRSRGNWSGTNIAVMVLGFVFFWPVGLFILFWIISGRNVGELPAWIRNVWSKAGMEGIWSKMTNWSCPGVSGLSDNMVFNEYQQTQYDRIHEIRQEIHDRGRRFKEFKSEARRRADEEEFNQFMSSAP